jgi:hypothetical protein
LVRCRLHHRRLDGRWGKNLNDHDVGSLVQDQTPDYDDNATPAFKGIPMRTAAETRAINSAMGTEQVTAVHPGE